MRPRKESKILLLTIQYPPVIGGVPTYYHYLTTRWDKGSMVVLTSMVPDSREPDAGLGFPVYRTDLMNDYEVVFNLRFIFRKIRLFIFITKIVFKEKIDIIIEGHTNLALLFLCFLMKMLFGKRYGNVYHGDVDSPSIRLKSDPLKRILMHHCCFVITNSAFAQDRLMRKFSYPRERISILHPGVDSDKFKPSGDGVEELRKKLGLEGKKIIMTISRLEKRKGQDMVVRSLPEIVAADKDVVYLLIGDGPYKSEVETIIQETKMQAYVRSFGYVRANELTLYYNLCDIFIMPNRELEDGDAEGFGIVFIEAGSCGKPVVAGRCNGALDAVEDGISGMLVDPYDPRDIAAKVSLLLKDDELRARLGENGRKRILERFQWDSNIKHFKDRFPAFLSGDLC
ncbi:MAG: glycosyltransferase family 4 protein [Candidatus Omnitrophota bacterium]